MATLGTELGTDESDGIDWLIDEADELSCGSGLLSPFTVTTIFLSVSGTTSSISSSEQSSNN